MQKFLSGALCFVAFGMIAQASIIPTLEDVNQVGPNEFQYLYSARLTAGERLDSTPDPRLVIFDFHGYVLGSLAVTGPWVGTEQMVGPTTPGLTPPNETNEWNLVITWMGGAIANGPIDPAFTFTANTTITCAAGQNCGLIDYQAQASKHNPLNPGAADEGVPTQNSGAVEGPSAVPEPGTMSLLGGGLLGLTWALRRRK